jgi:hypothetical protein
MLRTAGQSLVEQRMRVQASIHSLPSYRPQSGNRAQHRAAQSRDVPLRQGAHALRILWPAASLAIDHETAACLANGTLQASANCSETRASNKRWRVMKALQRWGPGARSHRAALPITRGRKMAPAATGATTTTIHAVCCVNSKLKLANKPPQRINICLNDAGFSCQRDG